MTIDEQAANKLWQEFRDAGGVQRELENVVPYAQPKREG